MLGEAARLVAGRYEVGAALGSGAAATVYEAFDWRIERRVALKLVRLPPAGEPEADAARVRFRRGAQAAGRLSHPNVVAVFDYGEDTEAAWIVMEVVQGGSLKGLLDRGDGSGGRGLPLPQTMLLMGQVLDALAYAHGCGVVHRDIKPANILLDADGAAKLADFGIARLDDSSMTHVGALMGTPAYMAPEQMRGEVVDARADLWAAGAVLYEMLTGAKPFDGTLASVMHKALNTEPPPPSARAAVGQGLGAALAPFDGVVAKALAKRPDHRFGSAAEFAAALRDAAAEAAPRTRGEMPAPPPSDDITLVLRHRREVPPPPPPPTPPDPFVPEPRLDPIAALRRTTEAAPWSRRPAPPTEPCDQHGPTAAPRTEPSGHPVVERGRERRRTDWIVVAGVAAAILVSAAAAFLVSGPPPLWTTATTATTTSPLPDPPSPPAAVERPPPAAPASAGPAPPPWRQAAAGGQPIAAPSPRTDHRRLADTLASWVTCGVVGAAADDAELSVTGLARSDEAAKVRHGVERLRLPAGAARVEIAGFDGPFCDVLAAVRAEALAPSPPPHAALASPAPLASGQPLRFRVTTPDWPSRLHITYLSLTGDSLADRRRDPPRRGADGARPARQRRLRRRRPVDGRRAVRHRPAARRRQRRAPLRPAAAPGRADRGVRARARGGAPRPARRAGPPGGGARRPGANRRRAVTPRIIGFLDRWPARRSHWRG
jgi:eukaryotic-like serine/threonine-protein kinase